MSFTLTDKNLRRLCEVNNFGIPSDKMVFFGLRGMLPVKLENQAFKSEQVLELNDVNYLNPRCTLKQWLPKDKEFDVFPGSTVPHQNYVSKSVSKNGKDANQLRTGYYSDYRKGVHKAGSPTGHDAFRQVSSHPIRRTGDDLDFDNDDRVEYENPNDNIHAGMVHGNQLSKFCECRLSGFNWISSM